MSEVEHTAKWHVDKAYTDKYLDKLSGYYQQICFWTETDTITATQAVLHTKIAEIETKHAQDMILLNLEQTVIATLCVFYATQPNQDIAYYVSNDLKPTLTTGTWRTGPWLAKSTWHDTDTGARQYIKETPTLTSPNRFVVIVMKRPPSGSRGNPL